MWIHLSRPDDAGEGMEFHINGQEWRRMPIGTKPKRGWNIAKCAQCDNKAIRIDHMYPYETAMTLCEDHKDNPVFD